MIAVDYLGAHRFSRKLPRNSGLTHPKQTMVLPHDKKYRDHRDHRDHNHVRRNVYGHCMSLQSYEKYVDVEVSILGGSSHLVSGL